MRTPVYPCGRCGRQSPQDNAATNACPACRSIAGVIEAAQARGGFLYREEIDFLATADRLRPILVRCGGCRFTCPAQDVMTLARIIEASGAEYVRDFSLLVTR